MNTELAVVQETTLAPTLLFGSDDPNDIIDSASAKATALKKVIDEKGLTSSIQGKEYVRVEGWTLLGSLVGCFPICTWSRRITEGDDGWEARVEVRTLDDRLIGAAEAQCTRSESTWAKRADFALRSMAQTRATSKAMRLPLGFIMALAGYEATPAEEMAYESQDAPQRTPGRIPARGRVVVPPMRTTIDADPQEPSADDAASEPQMRMIRALRTGLKWDAAKLHDLVLADLEIELETLSKRNASVVIDWLKKQPAD